MVQCWWAATNGGCGGWPSSGLGIAGLRCEVGPGAGGGGVGVVRRAQARPPVRVVVHAVGTSVPDKDGRRESGRGGRRKHPPPPPRSLP